jgi:hypothetical protein
MAGGRTATHTMMPIPADARLEVNCETSLDTSKYQQIYYLTEVLSRWSGYEYGT